jgi:predicted transcriptional regulator
MGRKKRMNGVWVSFQLDRADKRRMEQRAKATDRSTSSLYRQAAIEFLRNHPDSEFFVDAEPARGGWR